MNARRISMAIATLTASWAIALGGGMAAARPASGNGEAERFSQEIRRIFSTMKSTEYSHKT